MSQSPALQDSIVPVSFDLYAKDFAAFTRALGDSFARWGFAVISDHGMPQIKVDAALEETRAFFALPEAAKLKYKLPVQGQRGYTPFGVETAKGHTHYDL
jgi:isopenicillin N synthase-like dioxygenase